MKVTFEITSANINLNTLKRQPREAMESGRQ